MAGPLAGIRVIELAVLHAGPPIGYILGDLGAEVIKLERPGGDPYRSQSSFWFETLNRSKKSVVIDLKLEEGKMLLGKLVEKVDVFFSNFPEGLLARLGADYATLSAKNPALIFGVVSGLGDQGPDRERRAYD